MEATLIEPLHSIKAAVQAEDLGERRLRIILASLTVLTPPSKIERTDFPSVWNTMKTQDQTLTQVEGQIWQKLEEVEETCQEIYDLSDKLIYLELLNSVETLGTAVGVQSLTRNCQCPNTHLKLLRSLKDLKFGPRLTARIKKSIFSLSDAEKCKIRSLLPEFKPTRGYMSTKKIEIFGGLNARSIQHLDLGGKLSSFEVDKLGTILETNQNVLSINLARNSIHLINLTGLSQGLRINNSVLTINLSYNPLCDNGAKVVAEILKFNQTIATLYLYTSNIGDKGAISLAEALKVNHGLIALDLYDNQIRNDGANALAEALTVNRSLRSIDLEDNQIGETGSRAMIEVLDANQAIRKINLKWNDTPNYIRELTSSNPGSSRRICIDSP